MEFLVERAWLIFISLEVAALIFVLLFIGARYVLSLRRVSTIFLGVFLVTMILEGVLAFLVYKETGEMSTFQIVIMIFLIYAATFGISDFKRLDYTAREKIGAWRKVTLVTEEEVNRMKQLRHPKVVARKSRRWFYLHTIIFLTANIYFWNSYGTSERPWTYFFTHIEWFGDETLLQPFTSDMMNQIIRLWIIIYIVDTIINWSYTFFPNKSDGDK